MFVYYTYILLKVVYAKNEKQVAEVNLGQQLLLRMRNNLFGANVILG